MLPQRWIHVIDSALRSGFVVKYSSDHESQGVTRQLLVMSDLPPTGLLDDNCDTESTNRPNVMWFVLYGRDAVSTIY